jgi:hypothetical protein
MYASGAKATPSKTENFLPKLSTLHRLLRSTLTPRIGDATVCLQYERNLIQFYTEKKSFSIFDFILVEILSISKNTLRKLWLCPIDYDDDREDYRH